MSSVSRKPGSTTCLSAHRWPPLPHSTGSRKHGDQSSKQRGPGQGTRRGPGVLRELLLGSGMGFGAVHRPPNSKESRPQPMLCQGDVGEGNFGTCPPQGCSDPFPQSSAFPEDPQALLGMSRSPQTRAALLSRKTAAPQACVWSFRYSLWSERVRAPTPASPPQWRGWIPSLGWEPHSTGRDREPLPGPQPPRGRRRQHLSQSLQVGLREDRHAPPTPARMRLDHAALPSTWSPGPGRHMGHCWGFTEGHSEQVTVSHVPKASTQQEEPTLHKGRQGPPASPRGSALGMAPALLDSPGTGRTLSSLKERGFQLSCTPRLRGVHPTAHRCTPPPPTPGSVPARGSCWPLVRSRS